MVPSREISLVAEPINSLTLGGVARAWKTLLVLNSTEFVDGHGEVRGNGGEALAPLIQ